MFPDDEPAAANGAEPCTTVTVMSSFENAEMVANLAAGYNAQLRDVNGMCVVVAPVRDKSGVAAEAAAAGFPLLAPEQRPTVWLPDSGTWLGLARADGAAAVPADSESVGSSNIVLAMPAPLAEAIGWGTEPPGWNDVFESASDANLWSDLGHPEWGAFKLGKTSPIVATSGEAAMFASFGTASGDLANLSAAVVADPAVQSTVREHELATSHYMATPEHFLWHARQAEDEGSAADFLSAVIVDEKSVWDYNRGITSRDGVTRVEGAPPRGAACSDLPHRRLLRRRQPRRHPHRRLGRPERGGRRRRLRPLREDRAGPGDRAPVRLPRPERNARRRRRGCRPPRRRTRRASSPSPGRTSWPPSTRRSRIVRKRAQVLFLMDVSGSMDEPISATDTKLSAAKTAIAQALNHFTAGDNVGLAAFAQSPDGVLLPGNVSPVAEIGANRDAFLGALGGLQSMGDTPLFQAVDTFATQQAQSWSPDRITAIVLLSDGENDTNTPTIGADQMLATLHELHHTTPVLVFTLAYGADADVATLQSISSTTGAHYYDATDPSKLQAVLGDLVTSF